MKTYKTGWVYVIGHPEWKNQRVKIGMTNRSVEERVRELNTNSMIPGSAYPAYAVLVRNPEDVERAVHEELTNKRTDIKRELFELSEAEAAAKIYDYCTSIGINIMDQSGTERALMGVEPERVKERTLERERLEIKREEKRVRKEEKRARKQVELEVRRKQEEEKRVREQAEQMALREKKLADTIKIREIEEEKRRKAEKKDRQQRELQRTRENLLFNINHITTDERIKYRDTTLVMAASLKNPKQEGRWMLYVVAFFALLELYGIIVGNAPQHRGIFLFTGLPLGSLYFFIKFLDIPHNREKRNTNRNIVKHVDKYNKALNELKSEQEELIAQLLEIDEHAEFKKMPDPIKLPADYKRL
jgi:hypothetical protein